MKHPPDLAPPKRPTGIRSRTELLSSGAMRLADALPIPLVARHANGRVAFLNAAARRELGLEGLDSTEMTLTIILRGTDQAASSNVYLLSAEQEALVRLVARPCQLELDGDRSLEVLVLASAASPAALPIVPRSESPAGHALANNPVGNSPVSARPRRRFRAPSGVVFHPRQLLACASRRLLRQFRGNLDLSIAAAPTKRCDRRVRVDEIAFAEVLLNSAEWIFSRSIDRSLCISAVASGHRLRVSLEGTPSKSQNPQTSDPDWLRAVRPFVDVHRATFEVHDDAERIGIVISLTILR